MTFLMSIILLFLFLRFFIFWPAFSFMSMNTWLAFYYNIIFQSLLLEVVLRAHRLHASKVLLVWVEFCNGFEWQVEDSMMTHCTPRRVGALMIMPHL